MIFIIRKLKQIRLIIKTFAGVIISYANKIINPDFECAKNTVRCCDNRKSPNFRYHNIGDNIPICCATHLVQILEDVSTTLEKNNLQYFISFGTLLGSTRHGGIIPWDTDIDLVISEKNIDTIYLTLKSILDDKYHITIDNNKDIIGGKLIRVYLSQQNKLHVDLFPYSETEASVSFYLKKTIEKSDLFPLIKTKFYNLDLYAPKKIEKHLTILYGNDFMTHAYKQWAADKKKFKIADFKPANIKYIE